MLAILSHLEVTTVRGECPGCDAEIFYSCAYSDVRLQLKSFVNEPLTIVTVKARCVSCDTFVIYMNDYYNPSDEFALILAKSNWRPTTEGLCCPGCSEQNDQSAK